MIQRIQSVYLLVVTILLVVGLCLPVGTFVTGDHSLVTFSNLSMTLADGTVDYAPWALFAILLLSALLAFATIFLFKNRMLQIRLTVFSSVLLLGYYGTFLAFYFMTIEDGMSFSPSWTICLPFVCIVLNWLAIRAIGADEMLVKSYERLR